MEHHSAPPPLLLLLLLLAPGAQAFMANPILWPQPRTSQISSNVLYLDSGNFYIGHGPNSTANSSCSLLQEAFRR